MTFLAIDVGNTRLKWAQYAEPVPGSAPIAKGVEFLETIGKLADGPWASLSRPDQMLGCFVASTAVRRLVEEQMEIWDVVPRWVVPSPAEAGVKNGYDHPSRLGADRWVAMIGARNLMLQQGLLKPLIVVMVGTAVTVEAVATDGTFLGGIILPGHGIMLRALETGTAGLNVPTGSVELFPTNTSDALTSGGTYAIAGAVERMIQHLRRHCGQEPMCMMSGGAGWKVAPAMDHEVQLVELLIFHGLLQIAFERKFTPSQ